jgi:hypothetical protein
MLGPVLKKPSHPAMDVCENPTGPAPATPAVPAGNKGRLGP